METNLEAHAYETIAQLRQVIAEKDAEIERLRGRLKARDAVRRMIDMACEATWSPIEPAPPIPSDEMQEGV